MILYKEVDIFVLTIVEQLLLLLFFMYFKILDGLEIN